MKSLEQSTREAVKASREALASTQREAQSLISSMNEEIVRLSSSTPDKASGRFISHIQERTAEIERLFAKQAGVAESFNIVLFGRTGTGKSTLIEALTRGNGLPVSHGESDWTTNVEPKDWESCKVYDTPGVNGWGRMNKRVDLEQRARYAVEVADFVLVCFDSQSQQASEFTKVAEWVNQFNKPVIAVLNNRNSVWRLPPRVPIGSARASLSRTVAQHAGNIQDELASVSMLGVPVVAVASKRALFARATLPYHGPDRETLELHRQKYGAKKLELWSNLPTLEGLLVRCIEENAVALRMGALHDQLRGVLNALCEDMDATSKEAIAESSVLEAQTIEPLLCLLGYPVTDAARMAYFCEGMDRLEALERLRGRFQAPSVGEFKVFVQQRLTAELGALRSKSLDAAEETVASAFDRGERITGEQVRKKCLSTSEMETAAKCVLAEAHEFISRRTRLAYQDSIADLKARLLDAKDVTGDAGAGWKYGSWSLKAAGVLGGIAASLGTMAVTNFWNPLGWAAGAAAGVAVVGSGAAWLLGWLGGESRKRAEAQKLKARREALANVRQSVYTVYDEFKDSVSQEAEKIASSSAGRVVLPAVNQALDLRSLGSAGEKIAFRANSIKAEMPEKTNPQRLLWEAKEASERSVEDGDPNVSSKYWLGDSWIDDPEGLQQAFHLGEHKRSTFSDPGVLETLFSTFRDVWAHVTSDVKPGSGRRWLDQANQALTGDDLAKTAFAELNAIAVRGRPRLHLVGDYNTGKSSFIKRLLLDVGQPVPGDLHIRANPTTDKEIIYEWGSLDLVDTPGFQSSHESHTEAARRSFPDASAILYLFQPNLLTGDDASMQLVLKGSRDQLLVPKASRTFFIVNRSDELGVDPVDNPTRYRELAVRKQRELSEALGSRGISMSPKRILCMASDPFGLVGDRRDATSESYDSNRSWDGFDQFTRAYREIEAELLQTGVDRSLLEGGLARLARLDARQGAEMNQLVAQADAIGRLLSLVKEQKGEGMRLADDHRARLLRRVEEQAASLRDEVLSETDPVRLKLKASNLQKWWEDKALAVELEQWGKVAQKELETWRTQTEEVINRRFASAEFAHAFPDPTVGDGPASPSDSKGKAWFHDAFDKTSRFAGGASRDVVYGIGKGLGFKFKPWGAVKVARSLGKLGAVMSVVGVVLDIAFIFWEEHLHERREEDRKRLAEWLAQTVPRVVAAIADGDAEECGLIMAAGKYIGLLNSYSIELETEKIAKMQEIASIEKQRELYAVLGDSAEHSLGGHLWEER